MVCGSQWSIDRRIITYPGIAIGALILLALGHRSPVIVRGLSMFPGLRHSMLGNGAQSGGINRNRQLLHHPVNLLKWGVTAMRLGRALDNKYRHNMALQMRCGCEIYSGGAQTQPSITPNVPRQL